MRQKQYKVIIAGGGTGGHVFPAIAIAKALVRLMPEIEILFVGAQGKMEMEKVPAAGFSIKGLPVAGLQRKLTVKNLLFPFRVFKSLRMAGRIIRDFQPDVVVGVGGYASWPVARVAVRRKIPLLLQEQNSYPGLTNRLLSAKASKICVAYANMEHYFPNNKIVISGNPVRPEIQNTENLREESISFFGLNNEMKTVLVVGGSLGALTVNKAVQSSLSILADENVQLIWQTGSNYFENAINAASQYGDKNFRVFRFIERMDLAYSAADIIISRAGAIAISELCLVKKPVILIPSPNVAEDHQTKNARALADENAAIVLPDSEAVLHLGTMLADLLNDAEKQRKMQHEIARFGFGRADETIAQEIIELFG